MIPVCDTPLFFNLSDESKAVCVLYQGKIYKKRLQVLSWRPEPERYEIKPQLEEGEAEREMRKPAHSPERVV